MNLHRYLYPSIADDIREKMVFIGGPRQVGKTTLAKSIAASSAHATYLNWDDTTDRRMILQNQFDAQTTLIIFDELHKYRQWKNHIKGIYDKNKDRFQILVTGSARLDIYRRGGDSLMGRYHYYRLHPFSLSELESPAPKTTEPFRELHFPRSTKSSQTSLDNLVKFGGFPEPLFKQNERTLRRWQNDRVERLVKEDIRDVEFIRDLSALQILSDLLPARVGSLLSLNSLREDLSVAHKTITHWMDILERFYYHFRIYPYNVSTIKSLRKEPKLYLWDWSSVENMGNRFENVAASHLLKFTHFLHDAHGYKAELKFIRDVDGRETDFLVVVNKKPWFAVEVKLSDTAPSSHLMYFQRKLKIPFVYQVVSQSGVDHIKDNCRIISADSFLQGLV